MIFGWRRAVLGTKSQPLRLNPGSLAWSFGVAFQRKKPAAIGAKAPFPGFIEPALATSMAGGAGGPMNWTDLARHTAIAIGELGCTAVDV